METYKSYMMSSYNDDEVIRICISDVSEEDSLATYDEAKAKNMEVLSELIDDSYFENVSFRFFVATERTHRLPTTFYGKTIITIRKPKFWEVPKYTLIEEIEFAFGKKKRPAWKTYKGSLTNKT